jgi:hypothetical protein
MSEVDYFIADLADSLGDMKATPRQKEIAKATLRFAISFAKRREAARAGAPKALHAASYNSGLSAAAGVCRAHSKWAEDKIDGKLPIDGSQNQSFATISNTADDLAEMIEGIRTPASSSVTSKDAP